MNETQLEHRLTKIETKLDDLVELYEQIRSNEQKHMLILSRWRACPWGGGSTDSSCAPQGAWRLAMRRRENYVGENS